MHDPSNKNRILHLVLYSTDQGGPYDQMYLTTRQFYARFPNVKTVYYQFDPTVDKDKLDNDILRIRGEETFIPGILQKTIRAFEYFQNDFEQYDHVVRSNISSIINFHSLTNKLKTYALHSPFDYGSTYILDLQWLDPNSGIHDETYLGTRFASGTNIILSLSTIRYIVDNQDKINFTLIDDFAIGIFIKEHRPDIKIKCVAENAIIDVPNFNGNYKNLITFFNQHPYTIVYRNKSNIDRMVDSQQMQILCDLLDSYLST